MVWRRNVLLQLNPDHHRAVDPWYFGPDPQIRTTDSRIWICIRIRLRIRDILVRIRRSEPLQLDPDHHCAVDPWYSVIFWSGSGSGSVLGSGSGSVIFWSGSGSADPNHFMDPDHHFAVDPWYSVIFWSGSADPNHYNWIQIIIVL
jgi:hypothetical protein